MNIFKGFIDQLPLLAYLPISEKRRKLRKNIPRSEASKNSPINPLRPSIKLQILLLCFHTFRTEVVGRSC